MPADTQAGKPRIDLSRYELTIDGRRVKLERQPMDLLILLVQRQGQLVTREDIVDKLWGKDVFVDVDGSINAAVRKIRTALRDDPVHSKYVETVIGRGYRFISEVELVSAPSARSPSPPDSNRESSKSGPEAPSRLLRGLAVALGAAVVLTAVGVWWRLHRPNPPIARPQLATVAVLPFQNLGSDKSMDFLQLALADELVTTLAYASSISVRPFSAVLKYAQTDLDSQALGRDLNAAYLVTGHYVQQGSQLHVTLESTEVAGNRVLWREDVDGNQKDLIGLQAQLSTRIRQHLIPLLAGPGASIDPSQPRNAEAYDLYLRSLAVTRNLDGIAMLEQAVKLDPAYAPAWLALGHRYHDETLPFTSQDSSAEVHALAAFQHALLLDPNLVDAAASIIDRHVEQGQIELAYDEAELLMRRRPDSLDARATLAYILRYAGLLDEAARECDHILSLDPHHPSATACAVTFLQLARFDRALDYLQANPLTDFSRGVKADVLLRLNRFPEAMAIAPDTKDTGKDLLKACIEKQPAPRIVALVAHYDALYGSFPDPEAKYFQAAWDGFCGQKTAALRMLRRAVESHYCGYPAMDKEPLFNGIRREPEFAEIRSAAMQCQNEFLKRRSETH